MAKAATPQITVPNGSIKTSTTAAPKRNIPRTVQMSITPPYRYNVYGLGAVRNLYPSTSVDKLDKPVRIASIGIENANNTVTVTKHAQRNNKHIPRRLFLHITITPPYMNWIILSHPSPKYELGSGNVLFLGRLSMDQTENP